MAAWVSTAVLSFTVFLSLAENGDGIKCYKYDTHSCIADSTKCGKDHTCEGESCQSVSKIVAVLGGHESPTEHLSCLAAKQEDGCKNSTETPDDGVTIKKQTCVCNKDLCNSGAPSLTAGFPMAASVVSAVLSLLVAHGY